MKGKNMSTRLIIEGSAVYEIDEECMKKREQQSEEQNALLKKDKENPQDVCQKQKQSVNTGYFFGSGRGGKNRS